jgi:hypothetical protein
MRAKTGCIEGDKDRLRKSPLYVDAGRRWPAAMEGAGRVAAAVDKRRPDNGKMMIITPWLTFFFCQNKILVLNNALLVLRGLKCMPVEQRADLLEYVLEEYTVASGQLFEDHNAVYLLRRILSDMLKHASLPPTYILIHALDECRSGLSELLRIITDARPGRHSTAKSPVTIRGSVCRAQVAVAGGCA